MHTIPLTKLCNLFPMKTTASVTKSLHQNCGLCYLHLPICFLKANFCMNQTVLDNFDSLNFDFLHFLIFDSDY